MGFNELYKKCREILKISGFDYTPSKTDFSNHIRKMVENNELYKVQDESSKLKIKPEYYSLTDDAKKRRHLNLLGLGNEHERFRKIYEKLFFWEFFHTRPIPIPSEKKLVETITKLEQQMPSSQLRDLGWGQVTDMSNNFLKYKAGSREYHEYWTEKEKEGLQLIVQHIDNTYHVWPRPEIFFIKREYWEATKHSKKILFAKNILHLPGVSKEEFLKYHNRFSEIKFTDDEVDKAFLLLRESGLIKPYLVLANEVRYITTDDKLLGLIEAISGFFEHEIILLMFKWRYFEKPNEEEKKRLRWMLGEEYSRRIIQRTEIINHEIKKAIKKCKNINEYCRFLVEDLEGYPTWAVYGQIDADLSIYFHKYRDRRIEVLEKDVNGFFEFQRERLRFFESELFDWIKDAKKYYETTVQEYAYLFHHVLAMVCPLLLKLPAESYYSEEDKSK